METSASRAALNEAWMLFILPIRDGNDQILPSSTYSFILFILPIRDGNQKKAPSSGASISLFILPIRDGNL